ncbi:hypothetical protein IFM89_005157 [Coptis chinensis]|uniref:Uncharacterized protein n=1 Tax=Coptis chinensis TaxID=261450 RepID=A0A835IM78_9MAGN|nr:hypothetical protein IFM89_005157 [Coptis chinensis]
MNETSGDRSGNGCPAERMIVQKSNIDYNGGLSPELGLSLDPANVCTQPERQTGTGAGAGANANSRDEMVFLKTTPVSELVWSPHKGLSLKCADCSLSDKKTFSLGMVLSPPRCITVREAKDTYPVAEENINISQIVCHLDSQVSGRVTMIGSPSITKSFMPICQTTNHVRDLGSGREMKDSTNKDEHSILNMNNEHNQSDQKGKRICRNIDIQATEISRSTTKVISCNPEKDSIPGLKSEGTDDFSSTKVNEEKVISERVNAESGKGARSSPSQSGHSHTTGINSEYKHEELALVVQEEGTRKITAASSNLHLEKGDSTSENDIKPLKGKYACFEVGIMSHLGDDKSHNEGIFPEGEVAFIEAFPNKSRMPLYQTRDKEKVLSSVNVHAGILKDEDDSNDSAESCNSTGLILAGKRPWSFDQRLLIENKRVKRQNHENPHSASVQRHGSSFMNWISNMVKGSSKSDIEGTTSLDLTRRLSHHEHDLVTLPEKNQQSGSTGFGTLFKALYCPTISLPDREISNSDHHVGEGSKEHEVANKTCDNSGIPINCGEETDRLCKETATSTENQIICGDTEGPSSLPSENIYIIREDHKISTVENKNLTSLPCDTGNQGQVSSTSISRNDLESPVKDRETLKLGFSDPNKSNAVMNRSHPLGSLWITRFSPKLFGLILNSSQGEQNVGPAIDGPTDCIRNLSPSRDCVISVKDQDSCEDRHEPSSENHWEVANKELQNYVVSTPRSSGSIKVKDHTDQKFKSMISALQPSQRFKDSEAMASVFARRLDAIRHIIPSEVEGSASHPTETCNFCGIKGHKLQECSDITKSELEVLLEKNDDGGEESSCFCIRCFQLDHWAIACPNSLKKRRRSDGSYSLLDFSNFGKLLHTSKSDKVMVCECTVAVTVSDSKKPRVDTEFRASADLHEKVKDVMILDGSFPDSNLAKKDLPRSKFSEGNSLKNTSRAFILNGKPTRTSSSTENVSREYQITAFCNFVSRQIPAIPRGTFAAIMKLRLSRTDIFKWMRSPVSLSPLEGYFTRLRLRKWEKEVGSTGYYVARINGVLREKPFGCSKVPLSVKIGGFKCLVESRFVSNHDFLEIVSFIHYATTTPAREELLTSNNFAAFALMDEVTSQEFINEAWQDLTKSPQKQVDSSASKKKKTTGKS